MPEWELCTMRALNGLRLARHTVVAPDLASGPGGELWWLARPPAIREWHEVAGLRAERPVEWRLSQDGDDALLQVDGADSEADVVKLAGAAATAFFEQEDEALTIIGAYITMGGPRDLAAHISARGPLQPAFEPGRRWISDQLALSLYRVARRRGGAFWLGAARWIAAWAVERAARVEEGQTELRLVTDLALLLLAAGEPAAADRVLDELEHLATPFAGGTWYRHDRREVAAGRNDLVLNTHVYALVALAAAGRPLAPGQRALEAALALRAPAARGFALAAPIVLTDLAVAAGSRRAGATAWGLHERWAELRAEHPHLALVPGLLARHVTDTPGGRYYRTINLADLAALVRIAPTPRARAELKRGVRLASASGFFRVQLRSRESAAVLIPSLLRVAGHRRRAERAAAVARSHGWAPAIGWPAYVDELWPGLPAGVP